MINVGGGKFKIFDKLKYLKNTLRIKNSQWNKNVYHKNFCEEIQEDIEETFKKRTKLEKIFDDFLDQYPKQIPSELSKLDVLIYQKLKENRNAFKNKGKFNDFLTSIVNQMVESEMKQVHNLIHKSDDKTYDINNIFEHFEKYLNDDNEQQDSQKLDYEEKDLSKIILIKPLTSRYCLNHYIN